MHLKSKKSSKTSNNLAIINWLLFLAAIFIIITLPTVSQATPTNFVPVGLGGYVTELPEVWGGGAFQLGPSDQHDNPAIPRITTSFTGTVQSNDWWTSFIWKVYDNNTHSEGLYPHPLTAKGEASGLQIGYPTAINYTDNYHQRDHSWTVERGYFYLHEENSATDHTGTLVNSYSDLVVGLVDLNAPQTNVASYSDWLVTTEWNDGNRSMHVTLGHGLPFAYISDISGADALVTFSTTPTLFYGSNGDNVVGVTVNGNHYGLFAPSGKSWILNGLTAQATLDSKNYYAVALLPDNTATTIQDYANHAYAFPIDAQVNWIYDEANATINTTFTLSTTLKESGSGLVNNVLQALYHHQWDNLATNTPLSTYQYQSPRGTMKVFDGNSFSTQMTFHGVLPSLPAIDKTGTYSQTTLENYLVGTYDYFNNLYLGPDGLPPGEGADDGDPNAFFPAGPDGTYNTYWDGKKLAAYGEMIKIADELGYTYIKEGFIARMKDKMQDYLDGNGPTVIYYDETWDAMIGYPAGFGSEKSLNDIHFTWGYHIMAAATIARYDDSTWADTSEWGGMINLLIQNAANWDRNSTQFPFLRNFDPYAGHSWASGPAMFDHGNNEESTSEAINFATALILWGEETSNTTIRDLGVYLYVHETTTAQQYWFDVDDDIHPNSLAHLYTPMIWGAGAFYDVWWPATIEELHGINFMPINGGSLYLGHYPTNLSANIQYMHDFIADPTRLNPVDASGLYPELSQTAQIRWFEPILTAQALADAPSAVAELNAHIADPYSGYPGNWPGDYGNQEFGASEAHTYHWIHSFAALGNPDPTVTANIATYAVFNNNGTKTYSAYNATSSDLVVCFSDGATLSVVAGQVAHGDGNGPNCLAGTIITPTVTSTPTTTPIITSTPTTTPTITSTLTATPTATVIVPTSTPTGSLTTASSIYLPLILKNYSSSSSTPTATTVPSNTPTATTQPSSTPTATNTPGISVCDVDNLLYVLDGAALNVSAQLDFIEGTNASTDNIPATDGEHIGTPTNPLIYLINNVNGTYNSGDTAFNLYIDAYTTVGMGTQARIEYDFDGDGTYDRTETYNYFPTNPVDDWELYTESSFGGLSTVTGNFADLTDGSIRLQVWKAIGSNTASVDVRSSATTAQGQQSLITLPFNSLSYLCNNATPTPSPTSSITATPSVSPTPTVSPTPSVSPTSTVSPTPSVSPTATTVPDACLGVANAVIAAPGSGCYTILLPPDEQSITYWPAVDDSSTYSPATAKVTANYSGPYQTNDWWSSLIWDWNQGASSTPPKEPYSQNMHPHPFSMQAEPDGLRLTYSREIVATASEVSYLIAGDGAEHLHITVDGLNATETQVDSYSDWAVTAHWFSTNNSLQATFGHGLPYVFFTKTGSGNFKVQFVATPANVVNNGEVFVFTASNNVGSRYALFAPLGSTWNWVTDGLEAELIAPAGKDYLSVAALPTLDDTYLELYRQHAYNFVTDTEAIWSYNTATQKVNTTFNLTTQAMENDASLSSLPLMVLYPHQWLNLVADSPAFTGTSFITARGEMKVIATDSFNTEMTFNGVLPALPNLGTYVTSTLQTFISDFYSPDHDYWNGDPTEPNHDTYWEGKALNRVAQLVHIADQQGMITERDSFITY